MNIDLAPLNDAELQRLDDFLTAAEGMPDAMTVEIMDGYLHAIAAAPVDLEPKFWLPVIWGEGLGVLPPAPDKEQAQAIVDLVLRHFASIVAGLAAEPSVFAPLWNSVSYRDQDYDDAEAWACGFVEGMNLCWNDWLPLLETAEGRAWYRPLGLLGEEDFGDDQSRLTKTPPQRAKLAQQIPQAVVSMHAHWRPREEDGDLDAGPAQPKVGRNDPCPCGSGRKFKKCCGAAPGNPA
jgi:uncharacterized protein